MFNNKFALTFHFTSLTSEILVLYTATRDFTSRSASGRYDGKPEKLEEL